MSLVSGGNITFGGAIGETQRLGTLLTDAVNVTAASTIAARNLSVKAQDTATLRGNVAVDVGGQIEAVNVLLDGNLTATGGLLNLVGSREVRTGNITSNGGRIRVEGNAVSVGAIDSSQATGSGGAIDLTSKAGSLTARNLNSSGTTGGNIAVISRSNISALDVNSRGTQGNGGSVSLASIGNIQLGLINAQGGSSGTGGNVSAGAGNLCLANNVFNDISGNFSSISTFGGTGAGAIAIRHSGKSDRPFVVGGAIANGTQGTINAGADNVILLLSKLTPREVCQIRFR